MLAWQFPPILASAKTICIGYSGGMDSHVLLHALAQHYPLTQLRAIHINHGLHPQADAWGKHCQNICHALGIAIDILVVNAKPKPGHSPEAAAREVRYQAIKAVLSDGDSLVTAHHLDDQAETLLLQLLRGAGIAGLAAMPSVAPLGKGIHLRPFLEYPRTMLANYAKQHSLSWIEDSSNQDPRYVRNYIRHSIMPLLHTYWPNANKTIARSAQHCAQVHELLQTIAEQDYKTCWHMQDNSLSIKQLLNLSAAKRQQVIRYWLQKQGVSLPQRVHMQRIEHDILLSHPDTQPMVAWGEHKLCRYRDSLYCLPRQALQTPGNQEWHWDMHLPLSLPYGRLQAAKIKGAGLTAPSQVIVRFRTGGERCHPAGRQGSHPLKKLCQEWGIPPWERAYLPLILSANKIIAIPGYCIAQGYTANPEEEGWQLEWQRYR